MQTFNEASCSFVCRFSLSSLNCNLLIFYTNYTWRRVICILCILLVVTCDVIWVMCTSHNSSHRVLSLTSVVVLQWRDPGGRWPTYVEGNLLCCCRFYGPLISQTAERATSIKSIPEVGLYAELELWLRYLAHLSPNFTGVKNFAIWPQ